MSTIGGANITNNGLVAGYDTGYGVNTIDTISTVSYRGKPAINFIPDAKNMTNWDSYSNGNDGTFMTEFGTIGYLMRNRGSWNGLSKYISLSNGTHTFSAYYRYIGGSSSNNGATVYISGYGGSDTAVGINKSLVNQWVRYSHTVNVTSGGARFYIISYGGTYGADNSHWEVTMPQIEAGSQRSPFIDEDNMPARNDTSALINIGTANTVFTLYSSYDANGLPTFDGSDDFINVNNNPQNGNTSASWEFVVKFGAVHDNETSVYRQLYIQEASVWVGQYYDYIGIDLRKDNDAWFDGNGGIVTNSRVGPVSSNTWYHVVFTWDGSSVRGYLNSSLGFTTAVSGFTSIRNGTTPRMVGKRGSAQPLLGELPVFRAYNRALSQEEITNNFNSYKNRFDF